MPFVSAVIVAAGNSSRMQGINKISADVNGMPVLTRTVLAFDRCADISEIIVVCHPDSMETAEGLIPQCGKPVRLTSGGDTRSRSVANGVAACDGNAGYFAIHDGARPFVTPRLISAVIAGAVECGACAPGVAVTDTVKRTDGSGMICETVDRTGLVRVQTPQVFKKDIYLAALKNGGDETDDCALVEKTGVPVRIIPGDENNIKITTRADIARAEEIAGKMTKIRVGHGYDVHRLVEGRDLILCGEKIPYEKGLLGHSDADVAVHALCDALLGAAAMGDIGAWFPDSDPKYKGIDSLLLLKEVCRMLDEKGYRIENIDVTVICQAPKLRPYIDGMRARIASVTAVDAECVSIKATTEEGLGFTGDGSAVAAHAVVLLRQ